jgi:hypothetical protein
MASRPALEPIQPPIQWVPATIPSRLKLLERGADHSLQTSTEVKKYGSANQLPIHLFGKVLNWLSKEQLHLLPSMGFT